jgi:hypothetical protein
LSASSIIVLNDRTLIVTTPSHPAGAVDVTVSSTYGVGLGSGLFTFS